MLVSSLGFWGKGRTYERFGIRRESIEIFFLRLLVRTVDQAFLVLVEKDGASDPFEVRRAVHCGCCAGGVVLNGVDVLDICCERENAGCRSLI